MFRFSSPRSALDHYQALALSSRLETASPHQLVTILYEELARTLDVLAAALDIGKDAQALRAGFSRASSMIVALQSGLDGDSGGELARRLSAIYCAMQSQLFRAVNDMDAPKLRELRDGVQNLLIAWTDIGTREAA
jgi:flagellar secretion chaperone FliS